MVQIANVPSGTWLSSPESTGRIFGLLMTRENPYPKELPLAWQSCKDKRINEQSSQYNTRIMQIYNVNITRGKKKHHLVPRRAQTSAAT